MSLPKRLRDKVWDHHIGRDKGLALCKICDENEIDSKNFECCHIIARAHGGPDHINNLLPGCSNCNKSMGTRNGNYFKDFIDDFTGPLYTPSEINAIFVLTNKFQ